MIKNKKKNTQNVANPKPYNLNIISQITIYVK